MRRDWSGREGGIAIPRKTGRPDFMGIGPLTMLSLSRPAICRVPFACVPRCFFFGVGGERMVSSFIPLAKRGNRLILHRKML